MIVPVVIVCCLCLLCEEGGNPADRPIPRPRQREKIDRILCEGIGRGLEPGELVALVLAELHPGRDDSRTAERVTRRVMRRLQTPALIRRCRRLYGK